MRFRQDVYFAKGMAHMHLLYAHDTTWSLRIEDLTPGLHDRPGPELSGTAKVFYLPDNAVKDVALAELRDTDDQGSCGPGCHFGCRPPCRQLHRNSTPYLQRGWCRAEVQWSLARKASWKSIRIPFREGRNCEAPMAPSEFRAQAEKGTLKFTHRSDLEPVLQLQAKVFYEKAAEAALLSLGELPEAQVQVLARALPHYERLERVEVDNSELAGEALQALVRALPWSRLRKLRLTDSGFGDAGAKALGAGLGGHSSLRVLWLYGNRIGDSGLQAIAEGLADHKGLRELSLDNNGFGDAGMQALGDALKALPNIEELSLSENAIGDAGAQALGAGLGGHSSLRVLWLYGNRIGDSGLQAIAEGLADQKFLRELGLGKNGFGDAGTQALAAGLGGHASLQKLMLYGNRIGDAGIKALASALRPHAKLSDLRVFSNSITDAGLQALAEVLQHLSQMQYLGLRDNNFGDDGTKALAGVLPRLLKLTTLTLSQNRVSDAGAEALVHGLRDNRELKMLWLHENSLSDAGVEAVAAAFRDRTMEDLKLRPQNDVNRGDVLQTTGEALGGKMHELPRCSWNQSGKDVEFVRGVPFRAFDSYDCPNVGLICLDVKDEPDDIRAWSRFEEEGGMESVWNVKFKVRKTKYDGKVGGAPFCGSTLMCMICRAVKGEPVKVSIREFPPIYKSLGASGSLRIPALSSKPQTFVEGKVVSTLAENHHCIESMISDTQGPNEARSHGGCGGALEMKLATCEFMGVSLHLGASPMLDPDRVRLLNPANKESAELLGAAAVLALALSSGDLGVSPRPVEQRLKWFMRSRLQANSIYKWSDRLRPHSAGVPVQLAKPDPARVAEKALQSSIANFVVASAMISCVQTWQALSQAAGSGGGVREEPPADQPAEAEAAEASEPAKEEPESKAEAAQVAIYSLRDKNGLLAYCRDAKVRLVRADFLRELLAEGRTMPRRQEAEGMRTKDGRPALLAQEELEAKLPGGQVGFTHRFSVMALSHSWESREIPDVARFQLRVLVEALDTFAEILQKIAPAQNLAKDWEAAIFVDYMSLHQFPRTEEQDVYFAKGMANMHLLYAHDTTWSLRIEDLTPGLHDRPGPELSGTAKVFYLPDDAVTDVALAELRDTDETGSCGAGCHFGCRPPCPQLHRNSTPYLQRGWCRAEVQWSLARTGSWRSIRIPFREGRNSEAPMAPAEFRAQAERGTLKFTHRSDLEPVLQLQARVFREKAAEATQLSLAHLPEAQVQVLAHALPHYERLELVTVDDSELAGGAFQALVRALPWSRLRQLELTDSGFGDAEAEVGAHPLRLLCLSRSVAASQKWRGRVLCGVLPDFRGAS
ncbi:Nlrc3 [Symbiodinium natans]|uniref:Nlrc3 protein n=1 Tax=Symbiodinium natans TaxID=878477 RepID=A0A812UXR7_9DINO|nr:Nlrc3 [Symbiodinium natans]